MTQILKSLDEITTGFNVFESDQVLTAPQLNSIGNYFDDQDRLTRTQLLGVGIVCGLKTSVTGRQVSLSKGMGVTTDGDLLFFPEEKIFDRFRKYDESNPRYAPFYLEEKMIPLFELVPQGVTDRRAMPLSRFAEESGLKLASAVALLFMESYVFDPDLCEGTDCDNKGQEFRNIPRLLLVDRQYLGRLKSRIGTPKEAFAAFEEVLINRPSFTSVITTQDQFIQAYRSACTSVRQNLSAQLQNLYTNCSSFLSDIFPADPWQNWSERLDSLETAYTRSGVGIQYYYDFLRDVSTTFNEFLDLIFEDSTICSPSPELFPKHLIIGQAGRGLENDPDRTGLYRSPLTSHSLDKREHARFLAKKIDMLISSFRPPAEGNAAIRITPGKAESARLEERPIPYYYTIDREHPVQEVWNLALHRRGKDRYNYSYNADQYKAQGAAANPFGAQISQFDFFRIEGHLGQPIATVHAFLEAEIRRLNLPINSRSVMLSEDHGRLVIKPGFVFTDLHKLHNLMRTDLINQLDEVKRYSGGLKSQVLSNLDILDPEDRGTFKEVAESRDSELSSTVGLAAAKLGGSFMEYRKLNTENDSWRTHVSTAMQHSGNFKGQLSIAAKTEFSTPFDTFINNRHLDLLDHLDDLIKFDDEKRQKRLLFGNYIKEHPGLEHCAGVTKGGTFVVVYDEDGKVIGDFMLPYMEIDAAVLDQNEPALTIRPIRPGFVIDKGLNLFRPIDSKIRGKLDDFKVNELDNLINVKAEGIRTTLDNSWNAKFGEQQRDYFNTIKDSWGTMSTAFIRRINGDNLVGGLSGIQDLTLQKSVTDIRSKKDVLSSYRAKADQSTDPAEKQRYLDLSNTIEEDLSNTIHDATQHIANADMDVTVGTDAFNALLEIGNGIQAISNEAILSKTTENLSQLTGATRKNSFNLALGNLLRR